jgi:hypothetical protein
MPPMSLRQHTRQRLLMAPHLSKAGATALDQSEEPAASRVQPALVSCSVARVSNAGASPFARKQERSRFLRVGFAAARGPCRQGPRLYTRRRTALII